MPDAEANDEREEEVLGRVRIDVVVGTEIIEEDAGCATAGTDE